MKLLFQLVGVVVLVCLVAVAYKALQKACWENKASFINPPSLDAWDPIERIEAARQAAKKFGGKE